MNWFHEEDGGLIKFSAGSDLAYCLICKQTWNYLDFWWTAKDLQAAHHYSWISFNELSEDLQSAALAEML